MKYGIIGGTGVYEVPGMATEEEIITTRYGQAKVYLGQGVHDDLVFLTRHGVDHTIPPHKVNYRANITALKKLGVERVLATNAVGSLTTLVPPGGMVLLDQYIDASTHREGTFFTGGEAGLGHTDVTEPYCNTLRDAVYRLAQAEDFPLLPNGTYVCTNGPRFETSAEVRMFARLGGDVVGMTGATEAALAREAGLHFAAVGISINYGAGLRNSLITIEEDGLAEKQARLMSIFIRALRSPFEPQCNCDSAVHYSAQPKIDLFE